MLALARRCIARRRLVVLLWIVVLVCVGAAWQGLVGRHSSNVTLGHTGAQRPADLLQSRFPAQSGDGPVPHAEPTRTTFGDAHTPVRSLR
jgi:RND superfamily putative drug exporter